MTLSEKFQRIRTLDKDLIPEAIEDMNRYYDIATATTPRYENDGSQHNVSGNNKEAAMLNYTESSEKISVLQDELATLKLEVIAELNNIPNNRHRRIAKLYYIDHKTQKEIAHKITHYAYGSVRNTVSSLSNKSFKASSNAIIFSPLIDPI